MKLLLDRLCRDHPALIPDPTDRIKYAAIALQRAGHHSPADAMVEHDGQTAKAEIEWTSQDQTLIGILDANRVTEEGEAVAISYAYAKAKWTVYRRCQRYESADWLMRNEARWLALEVSGTAEGNGARRLKEKVKQVALCSLPAERLAVVVAFDGPSIHAGGA